MDLVDTILDELAQSILCCMKQLSAATIDARTLTTLTPAFHRNDVEAAIARHHALATAFCKCVAAEALAETSTPGFSWRHVARDGTAILGNTTQWIFPCIIPQIRNGRSRQRPALVEADEAR
mmetsp:Transcript_46385/g.129029  ORF Transcript_46385/g.129029 Transcript_46385/m.129029 type:complete len:122 (-) Transcript_46385:138-503(-)